MTLEELIAQHRRDSDDNLDPPFVSDATLTALFNEAENEACIRGRLIHDSSTAAVCQIDVTADTASYALHVSLYEITHIAFREDGETDRTTLRLVSTEWLDDNVADWRDESGDPLYAVQTDTKVRLVPNPDTNGTILLEGYRLPISAMALDADVPEINKAHHRHLGQWVLHKVYSIPDAEIFDLGKSDRAEAEFTRYFGRNPNADLRRITRHDTPHHNVAWL